MCDLLNGLFVLWTCRRMSRRYWRRFDPRRTCWRNTRRSTGNTWGQRCRPPSSNTARYRRLTRHTRPAPTPSSLLPFHSHRLVDECYKFTWRFRCEWVKLTGSMFLLNKLAFTRRFIKKWQITLVARLWIVYSSQGLIGNSVVHMHVNVPLCKSRSH